MTKIKNQKIDVKDYRILGEIDRNPRISTSELAKNIRTSQQVADYRLKNLISKGVITRLGTIINYHNLGLQQYRAFITLRDISDQEKVKLFEFLKKDQRVSWVARIGGKWDLMAVILVEDYNDLLAFFDSVYSKFGQFVRGHDIIRILYQEYQKHKYIEENDTTYVVDSRSRYPFELLDRLDELDYLILHEIKNNCRFSYLNLGNKLKTTYKTIQNRIRKLEKNRIIMGYKASFSSHKLKYLSYQLLINLSNFTQKDINNLIAYTRSNQKITQLNLSLGEWDVCLHLKARDLIEAQGVIIQLRDRFTVIKDYEITPIFEDVHIDYLPLSNELIKKRRQLELK